MSDEGRVTGDSESPEAFLLVLEKLLQVLADAEPAFDWYAQKNSKLTPLGTCARHLRAQTEMRKDFGIWLTRTAPNLLSSFDLTTNLEENAVVKKFDEFLAYRAEQIGTAIFLADCATSRIEFWQSNGMIKPFENLLEALKRHARVRTEDAKGDITSDFWRDLKDRCKRELALLRERTNTSDWVIIEREIKVHPACYPSLTRNLSSLREFCHHETTPLTLLINGFIAQFFDEWGGWSTGRSVESFRQSLTKLASTNKI